MYNYAGINIHDTSFDIGSTEVYADKYIHGRLGVKVGNVDGRQGLLRFAFLTGDYNGIGQGWGKDGKRKQGKFEGKFQTGGRFNSIAASRK